MSELGPVVVRRTIPASQASVWESLTDASLRRGWWQDAQIEPEVGGSVSAEGLEGNVDVLVDELTLGFRWHAPDETAERTVVMMLRPDDDDFANTRVTVIESGFAALPNAGELVQEAAAGWQSRFEALERVVLGDVEPDETVAEEAGEAEDAPEADEVKVGEVAEEAEVAEQAEVTEATDVVVEVVEIDADEDVFDEGDAPEAEAVDEEPVETERSIIEIVTDEVIDAEPIESESAIYLPEVSGAPYTESVVQITADLGVDEPVEVDETSEWERLLRGETLDDD